MTEEKHASINEPETISICMYIFIIKNYDGETQLYNLW